MSKPKEYLYPTKNIRAAAKAEMAAYLARTALDQLDNNMYNMGTLEDERKEVGKAVKLIAFLIDKLQAQTFGFIDQLEPKPIHQARAVLDEMSKAVADRASVPLAGWRLSEPIAELLKEAPELVQRDGELGPIWGLPILSISGQTGFELVPSSTSHTNAAGLSEYLSNLSYKHIRALGHFMPPKTRLNVPKIDEDVIDELVQHGCLVVAEHGGYVTEPVVRLWVMDYIERTRQADALAAIYKESSDG